MLRPLRFGWVRHWRRLVSYAVRAHVTLHALAAFFEVEEFTIYPVAYLRYIAYTYRVTCICIQLPMRNWCNYMLLCAMCSFLFEREDT